MGKLSWRDIAEFVAIFSVVASLLFVGYEIRLTRSIAVAERYEETATRYTVFFSEVAAHAEVWEKGCLDRELTPVENIVFSRLVQMANILAFSSWNSASTGVMGASPDIFSLQLAQSIFRFPGFKKAWRNIESNGSVAALEAATGPWAIEIERQIAFLTESSYPKEAEVSLCGR